MEEAPGERLLPLPAVSGMNGMDDNADGAGMGCVQVANPCRKARARGPADGRTRVRMLAAGTRDGGKSEMIVREKEPLEVVFLGRGYAEKTSCLSVCLSVCLSRWSKIKLLNPG